MCFSSKPNDPKPIPAAPDAQDAGVTQSRDAERTRKRQAASRTLLTGASGVTSPASTQIKTLLGA